MAETFANYINGELVKGNSAFASRTPANTGELVGLFTSDFEDGMRIARNVPFGLSPSIQTTNFARAFEYIYRAEAGLLTVNLPSAGVEYQLAFGGTRDSSFGPKEPGPAAMEFYSDYKTIYLKY